MLRQPGQVRAGSRNPERPFVFACLCCLALLGTRAAQAQIGPDVDWNWDSPEASEAPSLPEPSVSNFVIFADMIPLGFLSYEPLQIQIGNVRAISEVRDIRITLAPSAQLPHITSSALAVGNNAEFRSGAVDLDAGQFFFNVRDRDTAHVTHLTMTDIGDSSVDTIIDLIFANPDEIIPAKLEAVSAVSDITNATVDSSAIVIANNMEIWLDPGQAITRTSAVAVAHHSDPDAHEPTPVAFGHVVQFAYADLEATATADGVENDPSATSDRPATNTSAVTMGNRLEVHSGKGS